MPSSTPTSRSALSVSLIVLLFAPTLVGGHAHVADHDGAEHHVDAPHGAHEMSLVDGREQMPSTQLTIVLDANRVPAFDLALPAGVVRMTADAASGVTPARGPPRAVRSRAPPISL